MYEQLLKILRSIPDEFSELNLEQLPGPLKTIMTALMKLLYEELQGSRFIDQCVKNIHIGLANGTLKNFLRPRAAEEPSVA